MDQSEQVAAFESELNALVDRYCEEFDLLTASAIGVLEMKKHQLIAYAQREESEE